jgi:mRNA-degrading endonuclease RelE of RelBE toxin-antitoxin system
MAWSVELSHAAEKEFKKIPHDRRTRIARAIDELERNPLAGDIIPLKGPEWSGRYRKRVGPYRIIFTINRTTTTIAISGILVRSEKTYRNR